MVNAVLSCIQLFVTPWTVAHQAPLSMEFSRQESWSQLPFPTPEDLPDPGIELTSLASPALAGGFTTALPGKPNVNFKYPLLQSGASLAAQSVKNLPAVQETRS